MAHPRLTEFDLHLLGEGNHFRSYEKLGAHVHVVDGQVGTHFAVWAPNADYVSVIGDFNGWDQGRHKMENRGEGGIWEIYIEGVGNGDSYKFHVASPINGYKVNKADPYAFFSEVRPKTASRVFDIEGYDWADSAWIAKRGEANRTDGPMAIYELHLGSWMRVPGSNGWLTYKDMARNLAAYVTEMGFTHVELLPVSEHPLDASWGYQTTGYYAPTSRFGTPHEFMHLVDVLHQHDIGVLIDWVPAHFPRDEHGLGFFDGTALYEHADARQGEHPDWGTKIFNYGRNEVRNFLISNALFWLDKYHIDGLRVDAVASMLYLDYGREDGDWVPNQYGGKENIEAIDFIRKFNEQVYAEYPTAVTMAEESTSWGMVSGPTYLGGLGFGFKWNMGWMNDMLEYMSKDPVHRQFHHNDITFSMLYAFTENFVLPFSHDEVVHGKRSMLSKMPGDDWQKFANLRLLYGYMYAHPGKKLLFMGCEFGQWHEWYHGSSIDWHLLEYAPHQGLKNFVRDLNGLLRREKALHERDFSYEGFEWIDCNDHRASVISFLRHAIDGSDLLLIACNFTPIVRYDYRVGAPYGGQYREVLNSDAPEYGGSGVGNLGLVEAEEAETHSRPYTVPLTLPPLAIVVLKPEK